QTWFCSVHFPFTEDHEAWVQVVGVGNVEIPVRIRPNTRGKKTSGPAHGVVRLHNVLHAPTNICNIIGGNHILEKALG
ncbi:hypothetical protein QBC35DRAFT_388249, partial [Podospora australis]